MKHAVLLITEELLIEMIKRVKNPNRKISVIKNPLPGDVEPVRTYGISSSYYPQEGQGQLGIVLKSESFEDIPCGVMVPILPSPIFQDDQS